MTATLERPVIASMPATPSPVTPPKPKGLWAYLRVSLSAALLLLMIGIAVLVIVVPMLTKSTPMTVLTSSMEPGLPPGTLIIVQPVEPAEIEVGDIVTYQLRSGHPEVVTHRVIEIRNTTGGKLTFIMKGDNNSSPDPDPILQAQVRGRLWYSVPLIGWVNTWVNGENRSWIIPIVAGGLFVYAGAMVISGIVGSRRKAKQAANRRPGRHAA